MLKVQLAGIWLLSAQPHTAPPAHMGAVLNVKLPVKHIIRVSDQP